MKTKKLLSVIIAIVMVLSLLPAVASADTLTSEETINLKVNEKCSVSTKIDNEETYTTVELIGTLPDGLNWGYGEVEDPYINGTPTKEGTYTVTFKCNMYETSAQYRIMRIIGRIAFPLYAYCIAVGCV